jgi:hypothetical protein
MKFFDRNDKKPSLIPNRQQNLEPPQSPRGFGKKWLLENDEICQKIIKDGSKTTGITLDVGDILILSADGNPPLGLRG